VTVHLPGGADIAGKLRMLGPTVDLQSRSALVYVDLPAPEKAAPAARAGMYASGEFQLGSAPALTVPQAAVVLRDGFSYVYRVNPDNRVSQLKVRTGRRQGTRLELVEGVAPDALLVVDGAGFLNDGDLVRRADASSPSPSPSPAR
jgi:multidrug efflux pump subunit AcrA (membrane-fusion protein)